MFKLRKTWLWVASVFGAYGLAQVLDEEDLTCDDPGLDPLDEHDLCVEDPDLDDEDYDL
jgi:hypothetical protein